MSRRACCRSVADLGQCEDGEIISMVRSRGFPRIRARNLTLPTSSKSGARRVAAPHMWAEAVDNCVHLRPSVVCTYVVLGSWGRPGTRHGPGDPACRSQPSCPALARAEGHWLSVTTGRDSNQANRQHMGFWRWSLLEIRFTYTRSRLLSHKAPPHGGG